MANTSRANGLRPVDFIGNPYCGKVGTYMLLASQASAYYTYQPVKLLSASNSQGLQVVTALTGNGDASIPVGVIVGFSINPLDLNLAGSNRRAASTERYVYVADSPDQLFEIQEDATGGAAASNASGKNATLVGAGTGSDTTGFSNAQLDSSSIGVSASYILKIIGFSRRYDNEVSVSYAKLIVKFNHHARATGTTAGGGVVGV